MGSTDEQQAVLKRTSGLRAAVDPDTIEGLSFLQGRLALFGKWFFIAALGFYAVANLPLDWYMDRPFEWLDEWFGPEERLTLGLVGVSGATWLLARRVGTLRGLLLLDTVAVVGSCALLAAMLYELVLIKGEIHHVYLMLLGASNIIAVRAIVVPSTMRRTLLLSLAALVAPVGMVALCTIRSPEVSAAVASNLSIGAVMWATIAVASATATSRILFHLRGQVRQVQRLGQYTLEQEIGAGGMGVVYRASHAMLRRSTAVKLLLPDKTGDAALRRFEREVQRTAQLTHPNTIAIYDYGRTPAGVFYYAMEFVDGVTLQHLADEDGPQPAGRVIHLIRQACGALHEAHQAGLIHRDIKPANIMLCERGDQPDVIKVLDFGLVKDLGAEDEAMSRTDMVVGTPLYLAPEVIEDPAAVGPHADLYALGAVAYCLVTGKPVFEAKTVVALCSQHLGMTPLRPSERLGAPVPGDLEAVIMACLAKRPEDRPASARALSDALDTLGDAHAWTEAAARTWWKSFRTRSQTTGMRAMKMRRKPMDVDFDVRDAAEPDATRPLRRAL